MNLTRMNDQMWVPPQRSREPSVKVVEAMKGKTREEKKALLKELENRKQKEINLVYERERQQMLHDEQWAIKNVQEKMSAE